MNGNERSRSLPSHFIKKKSDMGNGKATRRLSLPKDSSYSSSLALSEFPQWRPTFVILPLKNGRFGVRNASNVALMHLGAQKIVEVAIFSAPQMTIT